MKRRASQLSYLQYASTPVRTGEHCPESGWWYPAPGERDTAAKDARFISEGNVMPAVAGNPALWLPQHQRAQAPQLQVSGAQPFTRREANGRVV